MPTVEELSTKYNVGRSTIREALKVLATQNIITIKQGSGTFISEQQGMSKDPLGLEYISDDINIIFDMVTLRLIFEPEIAYYATLRATDKELERINALKNEIEECITNKKNYAKQEMLFHCSIAQATHNEFMSRLEPVLQESIQKGVFLYEYEHVSNQNIISDNKTIMEFMNARNAEGAKSAMRIHILRAINQLKLEKK